jgi:hypothetical protein
MNVYEQLYERSSPHLLHYRDDLVKHDRCDIEKHAGVPFLHWTREMGTHISFHPAADTYPPYGELVTYLFGKADREHLLRSKVLIAEACAGPSCGDHKLVLYYNGATLREVTIDEAVQIARDYRQAIWEEWRSVFRNKAQKQLQEVLAS